MSVVKNRELFLSALRSGDYSKGPIETDENGRPLDPNAERYCAVGLAYELFHDEKKPWSPLPVRAALALSPRELAVIQQEWNDSELTFRWVACRNSSGWIYTARVRRSDPGEKTPLTFVGIVSSRAVTIIGTTLGEPKQKIGFLTGGGKNKKRRCI